ncbi:MAG TPA: mechanosensitive ion channel domain-containing protein [Steroidobacteraceae bacterium]|jgi:small conductance mechanosensitive channel|nr:mechanosensitive ion channel domain-containing protein [Steroidobacteraceae bacterium]
MSSGLETIDQIKATFIDLAIRFGPKLATALVIFTAGVFIANWCTRASARGLRRFELEPPVKMLLTRLVRVLVLAIFLILALQNLGVELLPLIAGLGVAGAGIALATQGVLSNVVAGLTIIFTKPYRVGEYVAVAGVEGEVTAISLFSTILTHPDRSRIVVPNRKVVGEILQNFGALRQSEILVGIAYESDLAAALSAIREVVAANSRVLSDPKPVVQVNALAASAVQIAIRPWVAVSDFGAISGELNLSIAEDLRRRGISIPFPQHEVRLIRDAA